MTQFPNDDIGTKDLVSRRDIILESDSDLDGVGDIVLKTGGVERARVTAAGVGSGFGALLGGYIPAVSDAATAAPEAAAVEATPLVLPEEVISAGQSRIGTLSATFEQRLHIAKAYSKILVARLAVTAAVVASVTDYWTVDLKKYPAQGPADLADVTDDFSTLTSTVALGATYTQGTAGTGFQMYGSTEGGSLMPATSGGNVRLHWRNDFQAGDGSVTIKSTQTAGAAADTADAVMKLSDKSNYLNFRVALGAATQYMRIHKVVAGVFTQLVTANLSTPIAAGVTTTWQRAKIVGNVVTLEFWTTDPTLGGDPTQTITATLAGGDATQFGVGVSGYVGFAGTTVTPAAFRLDDLRVTGAPRTILPVTVATKTTQAFQTGTNGKQGEELVANQSWSFSGQPFDETLRLCKPGDVITLKFTPTGSPASLVDPFMQVELMPL